MMSEEKGNGMAAFLAGALAGAALGAVMGMLYAPKSGTELRDQIRGEAQEQFDRAAAQWDRALKQVQQSVTDLQAEVKGYIEQAPPGGPTPTA